MTPPSVLFELCVRGAAPRQVRLYPGDLIGRLAGAALLIQDPQISEAHALLSLRGRSLKLLALRGALKIGERWLGDVELGLGKRVMLTEGVTLEVLDLSLPEHLLVLEGLPAGRAELLHPELSLCGEPPQVLQGHRQDALAWVWSSGERWFLRTPDTEPLPLEPGQRHTIAGRELSVTALPLGDAGAEKTKDLRTLHPPLTLRISLEQTEVLIQGRPPAVLSGQPARLLREVADLTAEGNSVHWQRVAERIWRVNPTEKNWYTTLGRLKDKLKELRIREDLIRYEGGQVRLDLRPGVDQMEILPD